MTGHNIPLGPGAEFDVIRAMLNLWGAVAQGIGDDAAVLSVLADQQLIVSTDTSVENVHFRKGWLSPHDIGARATTAALSDLAAMGAAADSVLVSMVVPEPWRASLLDIAAGIKQSAVAASARIVGGNMSRGATFSLSLTVLGHASAPVWRSGATPGDVLYVTGTLGGPQAAVAAFERGDAPPDWALARFVAPVARLNEGQWLAQHGARAMIDISDGLSADAQHLAAASGGTVELQSEQILRFPTVTAAEALTAGEEYELLVALPAAEAQRIAREFAEKFALPLTHVGTVVAGNSSARVELGGGHDHFSR